MYSFVFHLFARLEYSGFFDWIGGWKGGEGVVDVAGMACLANIFDASTPNK